jgi:hypothetical protein
MVLSRKELCASNTETKLLYPVEIRSAPLHKNARSSALEHANSESISIEVSDRGEYQVIGFQ